MYLKKSFSSLLRNKNHRKGILTGLPRGDFFREAKGRGQLGALIVPFWKTFVKRKMSTI